VKNLSKPSRLSRGFTLLEMMVVVLIIGLLAGFVGVNVLKNVDKAKRVAAAQQIKAFTEAVKTYRMDTSQYPDTSMGLLALIEQPAGVEGWDPEGYLDKMTEIPLDPWGHEYQYVYPGNYADFDIYSYGADGKDGGDGKDADIYNSDVSANPQQ